MRYLCLIYYEEAKLDALSRSEHDALVGEALAYDEELRKSGHSIESEALQPVQMATTLRVRSGGKVATTDGPFAETREQLGGFLLIEARDLNEAIRVASKIPPARLGCVEVRPVCRSGATSFDYQTESGQEPRFKIEKDDLSRRSAMTTSETTAQLETAQDLSNCMPAEPQKEHQWLRKLVGSWTYESEVPMGPDQPAQKFEGKETVRSLGGLWVVGESQGDMPGGGTATMIVTIGYDPQKKHYVGTWVGSMMTNLWVYEGHLNEAGTVLTLSAEGPKMTQEGPAEGTAQYQDVIEFEGDDRRTLTSRILGDDGTWHQIMKASYRRNS